ncbi:amino acid kinase family protein, partial [Pseudomonas aeruginosa]
MTARVREDLPRASRIVVKVGSSSISGDGAFRIDLIVDALARAREAGVEVVLVSSGAIATALPLLDLQGRP